MLYGSKNKIAKGGMPNRKMVMDKVEIAPGIVIYKNVMSGSESLVDNLEESVGTKAISWHKAYVSSEGVPAIDTNTRDTETIGVPYSPNPKEDLSSPQQAFYSILGKTFFDAFDSIEKDYCRSYEVTITNHDEYQILKYGKGQKFTNHIDDNYAYLRRVSMIYYINDNYVGGEINFPRFNISYKPKANDLLVFPSTYVYNHSVSEVTDGTRYAVVSWLS
jgi:hypothetical protein